MPPRRNSLAEERERKREKNDRPTNKSIALSKKSREERKKNNMPLNEKEEQYLRSLISADEHLYKFLFTNGFGHFEYNFSCERTQFNDAGQLFMTIVTREGEGTGDYYIDVPVDPPGGASNAPKSLDDKFMYRSTGVLGQYETQQRKVAKLLLGDCLKSMILFCNFQNVLAVQYDRLREYHFFGPSLAAMVKKVEAHKRKLSDEAYASSGSLQTFLRKVYEAYTRFDNVSMGSPVALTVYRCDDKYPASAFSPPLKESLVEGGRVHDIFRVQSVAVDPDTRQVFLDLGIYLFNKDPKVQYRLSTLDAFCSQFSVTPHHNTVIYSSASGRPNFSKTVVIGPLFYMGTKEPIESLTTAMVGMPAVVLTAEAAAQTRFSLQIQPDIKLKLEMDQEKEAGRALKEERSPAEIVSVFSSDIRASNNLMERVKLLSKEDIVRLRMAEYQR